MSNWQTAYDQFWDLQANGEPLTAVVPITIPEGTHRIRIRCRTLSTPVIVDHEQINTYFQVYTQYPTTTDSHNALIYQDFCNHYSRHSIPRPAAILLDPQDRFRGRWDPSFDGWMEIGEHQSNDGFADGIITPGYWTLFLYTIHRSIQSARIQLTIETSDSYGESVSDIPIYPIEDRPVHEVNIVWCAGELHEHTNRSSGSLSPDDTVTAYQNLGYHFLALTDHDTPPLHALHNPPAITLIRGQEIHWHFGHALLLGLQEWLATTPGENPDHLGEIIHDVHARGALFCIVHPFALRVDAPLPSWSLERMDWGLVDLLEIWPGSWSKRFPEVLKSFDLWDRLLNQGKRIYGTCGKGSHEPAAQDVLEKSPKTLVLSEGLSETQILSALKQGHFYSTTEPAISVHLESEHGGAFMGDELRIPIRCTYILYVDITRLERAYLRIKTNQGIYCEMPASSTHDTKMKFYERATADITWYRVEVYRYGRPLDELLAFSNPIFVRGMVSG